MPILGMNAVLKYGTAGTRANSNLTNVRNVTLNLETGESDVTTRANNGWRATVATLKDASLEWEMVWEAGDAGFNAIKSAFLGNSAISLLALSSATGEGLDADFMITNFTREEPLEEAIMVSVTAKPTLSTRAPSWYSGTGNLSGGTSPEGGSGSGGNTAE
jgi:hypothetical protein